MSASPRCAILAAAVAALTLLDPASAVELPEVTVQAQPSASDAQVIVITHDELMALGDSSLEDVLRRLPGISVDADGRIALRGMAAGYTQVLFNGRPLALQRGGAALEGVSLSSIERVEIVRGATAADGGEGIAGTIRLISRQATGEAERGVRLKLGTSAGGQLEPSAVLAWGGRGEVIAWQADLQYDRTHRRTDSTTRTQAGYDGGLGWEDATRRQRVAERDQHLGSAGEVAVRPGVDDRLALGWFAEVGPSRYDTQGRTAYAASWQDATDLTGDRSLESSSPFWHVAPTLRWDHATAGGGSLSTELGTEQSGSTDRWSYVDTEDQESSISAVRERLYRASLKWDQPLTTGWRTTLGSQWRQEGREENLAEDGETSLSQVMRRTTAAFGQLHWQPAADWRVEAGLRREWQDVTVTDSSEGDRTRQHRSDAPWLPSLNLSWTPLAGQEWHLGLARTYRQPLLKDLLPNVRRRGGYYNSPDLAGNPALRNERATGLEFGFSQTLMLHDRLAGEWHANLFARRIQNSLSTELLAYTDDDSGDTRWMLRPTNAGASRIVGLETGLRYSLSALPPDASLRLPVTLRADLTLTQSRVSGREAPSRLPGQTPAQLDLGFDARTPTASVRAWPALPDSWGATLRLEAGYSARVGPITVMTTRPMATLDLHAQWRVDADTRIRLRAAQVGQQWRTRSVLDQGDGDEVVTRVRSTRPWTLALTLEKDF